MEQRKRTARSPRVLLNHGPISGNRLQELFVSLFGIIRRPIPVKLREAIQLAGLAVVVLLMVTAFWNDIARLLGR